MKTYSMRAECHHDILNFLKKTEGKTLTKNFSQIKNFPDYKIEFTSSLKISELKNILAELEDSHVMLETLRACKLDNNSLERIQK